MCEGFMELPCELLLRVSWGNNGSLLTKEGFAIRDTTRKNRTGRKGKDRRLDIQKMNMAIAQMRARSHEQETTGWMLVEHGLGVHQKM